MTRNYLHTGTTLLLAFATAFGGTATAHADEDPKDGRQEQVETLDVEVDPLNEEWLITDEMEAGHSGTGCSYESAQTGVNPVPAAPSFQTMYVVPSDVTPAAHLDVPRSCSDGSVNYSSLAMSSRNMASWLAAQNAGLNFRTTTITYTHNYKGTPYSTRGVRRFRSPTTQATWSSTSMRTADGTRSPRLDKLADELDAAGFRQAATKYHALLDAGVPMTCGATSCTYTAGVAYRGGKYGFANRYFVESGTRKYHRFGCATKGDAGLFHEATHMLGATHVSDHPRDLMTTNGGGTATFKSSPSLLWDYGRDHYHGVVRSSTYVSLSAQPGSYFTCT